METKTCTICKIEKEVKYFGTHKYKSLKTGISKDYYNSYCNPCRAEQERIRRLKLKPEKDRIRAEKIKKQREQLEQKIFEPKYCKLCNKTKPANQFRLKKDKRKDGTIHRRLSYCCNKCEYIQKKPYLKKNREQQRERERKYSKTDKCKARKRKYYRENIHVKLRQIFATRIHTKIKKKLHTPKYIGGEMLMVKKWLEYNFAEDMTWENHGDLWQIDHTLALNSVNYKTKQEKKAKFMFDWKNLMPMKTTFNLKKNDSIYPKLMVFQELKVREFASLNNFDMEPINKYFKRYAKKLRVEIKKHGNIPRRSGKPLEPILPLQ
jgi:hypothetical protein